MTNWQCLSRNGWKADLQIKSGSSTLQVHNAARYRSIFIDVIARADAVVSVRNYQMTRVLEVAANEQNRSQCFTRVDVF